MNDMIMIKKTTVSICIACLVLGGCTEDRLLSGSQTPLSTEPVTVKLTLGIDDYNTLSAGSTRMEDIPPVLSMSSPEMDVELVATPIATRSASSPASGITEDNAVYSYMGFQFDGTKPDGKLLEKKFFTSPDGSIKTDEVEIARTPPGQKNMIVVLANVNKDEFASITQNVSTYADLKQLCMTFATDDGTFPRNKVTMPDGTVKTGIVMCGQVAAELSELGKQLYISLKRTVARVTFNITTTYPHFIDVAHTWNVTLMNIPTQNYYNIIGRKAIFPSEDLKDNSILFWSKSLATIITANPVIKTAPLYIPINLQHSVPTATQITRRNNAPTGGTYLQIIGLENKAGANDLNIVTDFSIYQLYLGRNFTTDYSVYANCDLTYNITLKGNTQDDSNVVRLIPGNFSGELTAYDANGNPLSTVDDANAVKWKYSNKLEVHYADGYYPKGSTSGTTEQGVKAMAWYAGTAFSNQGATSLTDGHKNTELLQAVGTPWEDYAAAYTCYRGTNGYNPGVSAQNIQWYLPSVSELIGTWISASSTQNQLAGSYWSSTADATEGKAFVITNEGKVYLDAVGNTHAVRATQDPGKVIHAAMAIK